MSDPAAVPVVIVIAMLAIPVVVVVLLGVVAGRKMTAVPLVFHCLRCDGEFHRSPHERFPTRCARCHARDWNSVDARDGARARDVIHRVEEQL